MAKIIKTLNAIGSWAKWAIYQGIRAAVVATIFVPLLFAVTNIFLIMYATFTLTSLATSFGFSSFRASMAKFAGWVFTGDKGTAVAQTLFKDASSSIATALLNNTINAVKMFPLVLVASGLFTLGYSVYWGTQFANLADGLMDLIAMPFNYLIGNQTVKTAVPVAEVVATSGITASDVERGNTANDASKVVKAASLTGTVSANPDDEIDPELAAIDEEAQRDAQTQHTAPEGNSGAPLVFAWAPILALPLALPLPTLCETPDNLKSTGVSSRPQRTPTPVDWD